jgi:hypothetical protein
MIVRKSINNGQLVDVSLLKLDYYLLFVQSYLISMIQCGNRYFV